jgi:phosphoenolpyruvate carboxylase
LTASAPREGTMAYALSRAGEAGISPMRLAAFFTGAMVMPVLTAHPTEVRRKSTIDREMEVAHLLAERDRPSMTAAEFDTIGIGGHLAVPPLPHHRAYGSRTTAVRPG